mmetsp:Transcript_9456/g.29177  ORF Transcript_9456/g.29177 Transcript_9456/m.29177 type:complete len:298 (+) Transcript_9456:46-939(+)
MQAAGLLAHRRLDACAHFDACEHLRVTGSSHPAHRPVVLLHRRLALQEVHVPIGKLLERNGPTPVAVDVQPELIDYSGGDLRTLRLRRELGVDEDLELLVVDEAAGVGVDGFELLPDLLDVEDVDAKLGGDFPHLTLLLRHHVLLNEIAEVRKTLHGKSAAVPLVELIEADGVAPVLVHELPSLPDLLLVQLALRLLQQRCQERHELVRLNDPGLVAVELLEDLRHFLDVTDDPLSRLAAASKQQRGPLLHHHLLGLSPALLRLLPVGDALLHVCHPPVKVALGRQSPAEPSGRTRR